MHIWRPRIHPVAHASGTTPSNQQKVQTNVPDFSSRFNSMCRRMSTSPQWLVQVHVILVLQTLWWLQLLQAVAPCHIEWHNSQINLALTWPECSTSIILGPYKQRQLGHLEICTTTLVLWNYQNMHCCPSTCKPSMLKFRKVPCAEQRYFCSALLTSQRHIVG